MGCIHIAGISGMKMRVLRIQKVCGGIGIELIAMIGSNDEKMSGNIKTWMTIFGFEG